MKTDKCQFDEVLKRMLKKPPKKTAEIKTPKKGLSLLRSERRKP